MQGQVGFGRFRFESRFRIRPVKLRKSESNVSSDLIKPIGDQWGSVTNDFLSNVIEYPILITTTGTICNFGFITRHQIQPAEQNQGKSIHLFGG